MPSYESQPNEAASKDCYLDQDAPDVTHATNAFLYVRNDTSSHWDTGLIAFDMSSIPPTAVIESASLFLWCYNVVEDDRSVVIHRVLVGWLEAQATHNNRKTGVAWNTAGCAGVGTDHSAILMGKKTSNDVWNEWEFVLNVSEAQAMFDDGAGYKGMRLRIGNPQSFKNDIRDFRSSSYVTNPLHRPRLRVLWHVPAARLIKYVTDIWDTGQNILDNQGRIVAPDEVETDEWIRLIGAGRPSSKVYADLIADPLVNYIESVSYRMDGDTVQIKTNKESMIQSFLKRLGGMSE